MKKKIGYFLLIVIAILGSRLLYGINFDLNKDTLVLDNLYRYDIIGNKDLLDTYIDGDYLYYVLGEVNPKKNNKELEYSFIKYDLANNQKVLENIFFNKNVLYPLKIVKRGKYFYLTSMHNNMYYKFNNKLELEEEFKNLNESGILYGIYNNNIFTINKNEIYYKNKLYDTLENTCGNVEDIFYNDNTYLKFYNYNKNLGCLYNMNNKSIYYLDYNSIDTSYNRFIEYQNNSIKFRYNGNNYYFNDITEASNLKMNVNGDYLFTYDSTNYYLRIYNLESKRVIYEKNISNLSNAYISDINISNYAYFTVYENNHKYLYFWDYLKSGMINKEMIDNDEKEYKFTNNQLINEISDKYNVYVNIYDQAVKYFKGFYVIPSYDDILINTRLKSLINILNSFNDTNFSRINIYFEKNISNNNIYYSYNYNQYEIVINIVDDSFRDNILKVLTNIKENNADILMEEIVEE